MTVPQAIAKWSGIDIQVSARMSRTAGVVPDQGQIVFRQGAAQLPTNVNGTLAFFYGGTLIDEFKNCRISRIVDVRGKVLDWQYSVKDRRWKWKYPVVWGRYNVRDAEGTIVEETKKTPRELATLLLQALKETGFNVEELPDDAELSPAVEWDFTPAARQLQELVAMYGCDVHLLPDNKVRIIRDGTGATPPDADLKRTPAGGLSILEAPDRLAAFAGDTRFDSWLELEPIMYEFPDGRVVLLDDSELKPTAGWQTVDLEECIEVAKGELDVTLRQRKRQQAKDGLYRLWRIKKFAGEATKPPGYTVDEDDEPYPDVEDMRLLLPLIPTRLLPGENTENGEKQMAPAEVGGFFWDPQLSRNQNHTNFRLIDTKGFSIDIARGHVRLAEPAYQFTTGDDSTGGRHFPAKLWLRCGYHLRQNLYGPPLTYVFTKPTGLENETEAEWINRSDVSRTVIATYPADYTEPFTPGDPIDNKENLETVLEAAVDEKLQQYAVQLDPTVYSYNKLKQIPTSGICRQVTHECGQGKLGTTTASVNFEHDVAQPLAMQKRQMQRDQDLASQQAQNFQIQVKMAKTALAFQTNGAFGT
jgi:hypothetical protein